MTTGDGMSVTDAREKIGSYRLLRQLGEGGMGVVHLAVDEQGRQVAVKVLHPHVASDLKARDRLTREVETMRRVRSNRVAEVLDADLTGAAPYIVTRFVPGRTLEQTVLEDGPLGAQEAIRLARGLCEALVAIHAAHVIHRDLKPANVMLVDGEPLVIDFGIAHLVNATRLTQTGMFVGTPGYLAPEIIRDTEITPAADVHALGATVFFAVTGQQPFGTGTFEAVCFNVLNGRAQLHLAPAWLRGWLQRAFDPDATTRATAAALLAMAQSLDPFATTLRMPPQDGATRLLDGTAVVESPDRTSVLPGNDTYSDLLPPVTYVTPERTTREPRPHFAPPPSTPPVSVDRAPDPRAPRYAPPPYQPSPYPPSPYPAPRYSGQRDAPRYRARQPLIAASLLVIVTALASLLPAVMSMVTIVLALALRIGHYVVRDVAERRSIRGSSAADPLLAVVGAPWAITRAVLATLIQVPLAAMFGVCVWGVLFYLGDLAADPAAAYAAGAFAAGLFVLPGGGPPRKAVSRALSSMIRSPGASMVITIVVGTVAFFAAMTALGAQASWAPWRPPSEAVDEIVTSLRKTGEDTVVNLLGGLLGDILRRFGLGFLVFWG